MSLLLQEIVSLGTTAQCYLFCRKCIPQRTILNNVHLYKYVSINKLHRGDLFMRITASASSTLTTRMCRSLRASKDNKFYLGNTFERNAQAHPSFSDSDSLMILQPRFYSGYCIISGISGQLSKKATAPYVCISRM